ncbi:MAG TPA: MBOAT family protein [Planctomycetota bacterium]|nr:MBOAT family protein [Planctomycetota bacterium]HRR80892.1 MBOAT family protein [Planctomycetota bacterium]HRT95835.1 MBOAT family protein [Planctomycetota bacterium]
MLFHTWVFAVFFLIVYPVYLATRGSRLRIPWLLFASYVFYGWWNPFYLLLIVASTSADYLAVLGMSRSRRKKPWVAFSVLVNLGMLGFFKYAGFVTQALNDLLQAIGIPYTVPVPDILLPVGISFFVFQSMTYTIDCYRGAMDREPCFLRYATYVSLFPQLVAGPIERSTNLLRQLRETPPITRHDVADGLSLFLVGLFKKRALADYLAMYVDPIYARPDQFGGLALLLATVGFAWQIYFDFSGYTDMARGLGRMMGLRLMLNFRNPYLATGLGDFWRRWHISLSTWFKDYVYVPLGGNRKGPARTYVNMALTMLISGLWHGANWTFAIWGALHAAGRVATRRLEGTRFYAERIPTAVKRLLVFAFVAFAWVFFRARTVGDAWLIVRRIFGSAWADPGFPLVAGVLVVGVWVYQWLYESRWRGVLLGASSARIALAVFMALYIALCCGAGDKAFIYFQF